MYVCADLFAVRTTFFYVFALSCIHKFLGIQMGTERAPLVADVFLFCYERDDSLMINRLIIDTFNTTSRYLNDI